MSVSVSVRVKGHFASEPADMERAVVILRLGLGLGLGSALGLVLVLM